MKNQNTIKTSEKSIIFQLKKQHKQKQNELIARNKKLLAIIGHDLKNQMSTTISFLSLLKDEILDLDTIKIKQYITFSLQAADNTASMLDNLLEWANSKNIGKSYQPEYFVFNDILVDEMKNIKLYASQKHIGINSKVSEEVEIYADKNMVKSILRNLINNAIKFSFEYGHIEIMSAKNDDFLEVTIKDYGVGINTEMMSTLTSTKNNESSLGTNGEAGTGFGLKLCKEFIGLHMGKIWNADNMNQGSEIKFTLPVSPQ
ncbi:sensor histidine kinase [Saccharicrinis aurantiacus]|uniref:sensor histidine kinase n=1 Tax=Saccharicrinis aurantiacus TaxID=1849719 RepID=UPI00094FB08B|nr:HAMP domain-containing sensor histidine kinase [Saccharicrinis aurantiacus]